MKNKITIFTDKIKLRNGTLTTVGEKQLVALLNAQKQLDELLENIKDELGVAMEKTNTNSIESEEIKITRSVTGRRYNFDPDKPVDKQFTQMVSYSQVNSKAIEAYVTLNGSVPEGILENARKIKVDIKLNEENL